MGNQYVSIRKIVTYLNNEEENGGFWLPNIQRNFVWKEEQIERLFDSIMREYPISTLLVWKTKNDVRCRKFIDNWKGEIDITSFNVPENTKVKRLVLDGQQRLQSLFIGIRGSYQTRELYLDLLSGHSLSPEDKKFDFKFLEKDTVNSFNKKLFFKLKDLVLSDDAPNRIVNKIVNQSSRAISQNEKNTIEDNVYTVKNQFCQKDLIVYQELDSVDNPEAYSEDDVVEIFIRANSGGTQLSKSDLLFSLLSSKWNDADGRMKELLDDLNRTGFNFTRDFILKTCLTLLNKGATYEVKKFRDEDTMQNLIDNWEEIGDSIKAVKDFVVGKTFIRSDKAMTSYLPLIPIIYLHHYHVKQLNKVPKLSEYILRTLLSGSFSGTPDNLINKCVKSINVNETLNVDEIYSIIKEEGRNLEISDKNILSQKYYSRDIHLIFNLWYKQFDYNPSYENNSPQIDHIFPISLLKKIKRFNEATGKNDLLEYYQEERDQIANLMLLSAEENGFSDKCDTPPDIWFSDKTPEYLKLHLIPEDPELWKIDNFRRFIEARKELIKERFKDYIYIDD